MIYLVTAIMKYVSYIMATLYAILIVLFVLSQVCFQTHIMDNKRWCVKVDK